MAVPVGLEGAGLGVGALDGPVAGRGSGVALDHGCAAASSGSEGAKNGRVTALRLPVTKSWLMGSSLETTLSAPQLCSRFFEPRKKTQRERLHLPKPYQCEVAARF